MTDRPETIPQINILLYTVKLRTGEELLCTLVDETDIGIMIEEPITVKMIPIMTEAGLVNQLSACAFMPYTDDRSFFIDSVDLMLCKPMHIELHKLYTALVNKSHIIKDEDIATEEFVASPVVGQYIH